MHSVDFPLETNMTYSQFQNILLRLINQEKYDSDKSIQTYVIVNGKEYAIKKGFDQCYAKKIKPGKIVDFVIYKQESDISSGRTHKSQLKKASTELTVVQIAENKKLQEYEKKIKEQFDELDQINQKYMNQ